jgi:hypothetical protein
MSFRRRHRWTRRILLGLACAALVAPAAEAKVRPFGPGHDDSAVAAGQAGVADFSGANGDPYLTDIASRPAEAVATGPDGTIVSSSGEIAPVRPDDRADRFVVGDATPAATTVDDGSTLNWENGLTYGIGALALALALGLAVATLRRPRLAGL